MAETDDPKTAAAAEAVVEAVAAAVARVAGPLYVGLSGGRDSTVLLHATASVRRGRVTAVHVNHGLHPEADGWQRHSAELAAALGVGFLARKVTVPRGGSLEAAARAARYAVFSELLATSEARLLLAHHRRDQAETVLLRLLQGRGAYGMPEERALGKGRLIRPLLPVPADFVARYAERWRLEWVEDPANLDPAVDRSFLRHRVMPMLRARWPGCEDALLAVMERHRLAERRLLDLLEDNGRDALPLAVLEGLGAAEGVDLLRLWLARRRVAPPARRALGEFLRQAYTAPADRHPRLALAGHLLVRDGAAVRVIEPPPRVDGVYPAPLPGVVRLPHGDVVVEADPAGWQPDGQVAVRFRAGGERLEVRGCRRSLKDLFQEAGVPPWQRNAYPLLYDAAGLLAVPGLWQRAAKGRAGRRWRAEWHPARVPDEPGGGRA